MSNNFYRIFFQGHIFLIIAFFFLLLALIYFEKFWLRKKIIIGLMTINFLSGLVIFTSYSRSFWVGFIAGLIGCYIIILFIIKIPRQRVLWLTIFLLFIFALEYGLAWGIVNFPWPQSDQFIAWGSLIEERTRDVSEEPAGASRFNLLSPLINKILESPIIGSGFGTKVSFKTEDPRYLELHPDGQRTTYSFEWGYLDALTEYGLLGLLAYLLLIIQIIKQGWQIYKRISDINIKILITGLILGFFIIMIINFFTPYLNHPLGIGYLIIMSAILYYLQKYSQQKHAV
jgi:O-antigen ligase